MKERNTSLDLVRIVACYCVISVHFFLNNGFYTITVEGGKAYAAVLVRTAFMTCVPLFILLTGYLMNRKRLQKGYFRGIAKTLWIYLIVSVVCIVCKVVFWDEGADMKSLLLGVLNFRTADYSWYVEMYIGLFLLIPFLNLAYHHLETKKQKRQLVLIMLLLTALPGVLNVYNFGQEGWWSRPSSSTSYQTVYLQFWTSLYPVTYYFIGCYLCEYKIRMKKIPNFLLFILAVVVFGSYNYWRSHDSVFIHGPWQDWGALPNVVMSVLLFLLLAGMDFSGSPQWFRYFLGKVSDLCLGAYLISCLFDRCFYAVLNERISEVPERLNYYFAIVPLVFVCSLLASWGVNLIYRTGKRAVSMVKRRHHFD